MAVDIHKQIDAFKAKKKVCEEFPEGKNKEILLKYVQWHEYLIEQGNMAHSSSVRSLRHAINLCDYFPDITNVSQKKVEEWYAFEMNKEKVHKTSTGTFKPMGCKRSPDTLEDFSTQAIKFFKFVKFLEKGKPFQLFSSKRSPMPVECEFIGIDLPKKKQYEKPKVKQEQIKDLIEYLRRKNTYAYDLCGVLVALLNDTGMRFSEACTLRIRDVQPEEDYFVITLQESKTKTRTIVSILAKPYLLSWMSKHPFKDDENALLFCNREGRPVNYDVLRRVFIRGLRDLNIEWQKRSSFHYLRHLFAARASVFPDFYLKYWMGWHDSSMRSHYTQNTYRECLSYYKKMLRNENNPMVDEPLSVLEKKERQANSSLQDRVKALERLIDIATSGGDVEDFIVRKFKEAGRT